jgi:hypothetical protein
MGRKIGASYRRVARSKRAGIEAGAKISPATVSSEEETVGGDEADRWVPPVIGGREEGSVPVRYPSWAAGWFLLVGRRVPRGPFSFLFCFLLFFFCFLVSFIDFAY